MAKVEYLNYDENIDHLTIYKANEKIVSSINTGLSILSLNKGKEIVGLEFMGANKNFNVSLEVLKHLTGCKVNLRYDPTNKNLIITVLLRYEKIEQSIVNSYGNVDLGKSPFNETLTCSASAAASA